MAEERGLELHYNNQILPIPFVLQCFHCSVDVSVKPRRFVEYLINIRGKFFQLIVVKFVICLAQ